MKQTLFNIPGSTISKKYKRLVDYRNKTAGATDYLTVQESNERLKKKYSF